MCLFEKVPTISGILMKRFYLLAAGLVLSSLTLTAANTPISLSGWNRDIVVEASATAPYSSAAAPFDVPNNYGFYAAGLPGGTRGLPASRSFTSLLDGTTVFQFQPYTGNNVLQLSASTSSFGTLTFSTPGIYSSLSILAAAANSGASMGNLVIHFADASVSPVLQFNNSDWFFQPNPAIMGFGRQDLGSITPEDNGASFPELYSTTLNLAALGLNTKPIVSIDFTDLSSDPRESTGVFAISGTLVPEPGTTALLITGAALLAFRRRKA
jgi:predicted small secreted protein